MVYIKFKNNSITNIHNCLKNYIDDMFVHAPKIIKRLCEENDKTKTNGYHRICVNKTCKILYFIKIFKFDLKNTSIMI